MCYKCNKNSCGGGSCQKEDNHCAPRVKYQGRDIICADVKRNEDISSVIQKIGELTCGILEVIAMHLKLTVTDANGCKHQDYWTYYYMDQL